MMVSWLRHLYWIPVKKQPIQNTWQYVEREKKKSYWQINLVFSVWLVYLLVLLYRNATEKNPQCILAWLYYLAKLIGWVWQHLILGVAHCATYKSVVCLEFSDTHEASCAVYHINPIWILFTVWVHATKQEGGAGLPQRFPMLRKSFSSHPPRMCAYLLIFYRLLRCLPAATSRLWIGAGAQDNVLVLG